MWSGPRKLVSGFAVVAAAYYLYALVAVPLIEPSVKRRLAPAEGEAAENAPGERANPLARLFPPGAWELEEPKILETDDGLLLLKEYWPRDGGRLELKPCTAILNTPTDGAEGPPRKRPVILQAPAGAELQFDQLDWPRSRIGSLQGGRLNGPVTIRSPESRPGAGDAIEFQTRDILLTQEQVHAPHPVTFRYGGSHGSGRDLRITLRPADRTPGATAKAGRTGIGTPQTLELAHVDKVHLELETATELTASQGRSARQQPRTTVPLEISCQGPFRHDFTTQTASLEDRVEVVHANADGEPDRLQCRVLLIALATRATGARDGERPAEGQLRDMRELAVAQIEARGSPTVLRAPSYAAFAQAETLAFDLRTRVFRIEDRRQTTLRFRQYEVETRDLTYQLAPDNRLGQLRANGPGVLRGPLAQLSGQTLEARWNERVIIQPDQGCHAVSLCSQATLECPGLGQFAADNVHVWLRETTEPATPPQGKPRISYLPDRVLAERNVKVDSWTLRGATQRAEVWIRYAPAPAPNTVQAPSPARGSQPERKGPMPATQRFDVTAEQLQAQLVHRAERTAVEHLNLEGRVHLNAVQLDRPQEPPFRVVGDSLRVEDADKLRTQVRVRGVPAEVAGRGLTLTGGDIRLRRAENRLWVDGPGTMRLAPTARKPRAGEQARTATPADGTPFDVAWRGQLDFDGSMAKFRQDVEVRGQQPGPDGQLFDMELRGEALDAALTRHIDFSQDKPDGEVDLRELFFHGDVELASRGSRQNQRLSIEHMKVRDLRLDQGTGKLHAAGPGWGTSVRRKQGMPAGPATPRPAPAERSGDELIYVRVDYDDELTGNIQTRDLEFRGRVRATYGPVSDWDGKLETEPQDGFAEGQLLLSSDRLTVAEIGPRGPQDETPIELAAIGNAMVEGDKFTARGWRIAYARAKQLLILEGDGRNDAEFWRRGSTAPDAAAQQIRFWQNENRLDYSQRRYLNLGPIGK